MKSTLNISQALAVSTLQASNEELNKMSAQLISGAQSATMIKASPEFAALTLDEAIKVFRAARDAKQIATKSGKLVTCDPEADRTADALNYTYRFLAAQTRSFTGTSHSMQLLSAALVIHEKLIAPREREAQKERKADAPQNVTTVRTARTTQNVTAARNISVAWNDTMEAFLETARNAWYEQHAALARKAQEQRNAQAVEAVSNVEKMAAALNMSVPDFISFVQKNTKE